MSSEPVAEPETLTEPRKVPRWELEARELNRIFDRTLSRQRRAVRRWVRLRQRRRTRLTIGVVLGIEAAIALLWWLVR